MDGLTDRMVPMGSMTTIPSTAAFSAASNQRASPPAPLKAGGRPAPPLVSSSVELIGKDNQTSDRAGRRDDAVAQGEPHDLRTVVQVELVEDVADVELDGVLAHAQLLRQLAVRGDAAHEQLEHLPLAV